VRSTLAWRLFLLLSSLCVLAVGTAGFLMLRPPIAQRGYTAVDQDLAVIGPLHDVLSPAAFAAYLVARSSPDLERGIEYTLVLADGSVVLGQPSALALRASQNAGFEEYDPAAETAEPGPRLAMRRCFTNRDCLVVGDRIERRIAEFRVSILHSLEAFLAGIGPALILLLYAARTAARDLDETKRAVANLLDGDLAQRLPVGMKTGFSSITGKLNRLLERIEHLTLANRTVIDSTAHDLRAPLFRLRARLEQGLQVGRSVDQMTDTVEMALHEVDRIDSTLDALLRITLAESGTASFAAVNVAEVTADVCDLYRPIAEDKGLHLTVHLNPVGLVRANAQLLAQAIANLLDNAIKYTPSGGRVTVRVSKESRGLVISVADTGPGIAVADRGRAVERSTRLANAAGTQGSGLGLALVVAVARLHGGVLKFDDGKPGLVADIVLAP
jgi:signal transduction histidine kinase